MTIIGHGTYGCIYRPPIKCASSKQKKGATKNKTRRISYTNKIAKLLTQKNAQTEYDEYNIISKIDPKNKYHLGKPILCEADAADLKKQTDEHPCQKYEDEKNDEEFSLLIMEYGGIELKDYLTMSTEMTNTFWKKARNLFEGAQLFAKHGLTHRDIKPSNVLLNPKTNKLIYIDFGLSRNVDELTQDIVSGKKKTSFHWSYPFEYGLVSRANQIITMSDAKTDEFYAFVLNEVAINAKTESYGNFKTMLTFMENRLSPLNEAKIESMVYDSIDSIRQFNNEKECIETMVKTIDMFSLGLTMNEALNAFYDNGKITEEFYIDMHELFSKMMSFNMKERISDYEMATHLYDKILKKFKMKSRN
jgi:serine/threonine protein kinase